MLDDPDKTDRLLALLEAQLPFEVLLTPILTQELKSRSVAAVSAGKHLVTWISYAGDEGGIMCRVESCEGREGLVVSLTHLIVPAKVPIAAEVTAYQKRRVKKLKKLHQL